MSTAVRVLQGKFGRVALLDMDRPLVTHAHSQCHVLIKVSGEDTFFSVRDKQHPLTDDTAVLVNSWEPHAYTHHNPDAPRTIILALYIEPVWLVEIEKKLISSGHPGFFLHPCAQISKPIRKLASSLAMQMLYGDELSEQALQLQLSDLMINIVDSFSEWRNLHGLQKTSMAPPADFRIRRAINYMRNHIGAELDMDQLASEACLSRAHFFKLFQKHTNLTPNLYANVLRMEAAIEGLAHTQQPLASISNELGFSAQSHFTRFFQQHFGAVPSHYRKVVNIYHQGDGRVIAPANSL